jgi:hypothetical protein
MRERLIHDFWRELDALSGVSAIRRASRNAGKRATIYRDGIAGAAFGIGVSVDVLYFLKKTDSGVRT